MTLLRVGLTQAVPPGVLKLLSTDFEIVALNSNDARPGSDMTKLHHLDGLIVAPGDQIDAEFIGQLPASLKIIASYSAGLDHVDTEAAARRSIIVSNTPDVLTEATADVSILLILSVLRGAAHAASELRNGNWQGWAPDQVWGYDLRGKTLGIYGSGRIGLATAERAKAFGMKLVYFAGRRRNDAFENIGAQPVTTLNTFLSHCDVLSLHCPLTEETKRLIGHDQITHMPKGSCLINTARGGLLDDEAVISAVQRGDLFGIGLDVFEGEPNIHPGYLDLENAVLLPHIGSATHEARQKMGEIVIEHLRAALI